MKEYKPIKRDKAFVAFSKDHHFSLLLVWKIRKDLADRVTGTHIRNYLLEFFNDSLQQHFKEEEELIFGKLPGDDDLRKQAEKEHTGIYLLVESIRKNNGDRDLLKQFADLLEAHVRFEERVLFNYLQEKMTPGELEEVFLNLKEYDDAGKGSKLFRAEKQMSQKPSLRRQ